MAHDSRVRRGYAFCGLCSGCDEYTRSTLVPIALAEALAARLESVASAAGALPSVGATMRAAAEAAARYDGRSEALGALVAACDTADGEPGGRAAVLREVAGHLTACVTALRAYQQRVDAEQAAAFAAGAPSFSEGDEGDGSPFGYSVAPRGYLGPRANWWEAEWLASLPPHLALPWSAACYAAERLLERGVECRLGVPASVAARRCPDAAPAALRLGFRTQVVAIGKGMKRDLRWQPAALALLQAAAEEFVVDHMRAGASGLAGR